jgi:UPF0176 protein
MSAITNAAAYQFVPLTDLPPLRAQLLSRANELGLKGTVLLSPEGINLFVAGAADDVDAFLATVRALPGLATLKAKLSQSAEQPFGHMRVKLKREIIAFGIEGIDPARQPSPKISPQTLKQWLDEGRSLTLLDTRNEYEVAAGTFRGALNPKIRTFREFPAAVKKLPAEVKTHPVVMFCTGGIRCEKAGPLMVREGYEVFQLEDGILGYFAACGGAHYDGTCFVFDERGGVDDGLAPAAPTAT